MRSLMWTFMLGIGATLLVDLLASVRARWFAVPRPNYALIGRWVGHWPKARFWHASISQAPAIRHEQALGWLVHYVVGLSFAAIFVRWVGTSWLATPSLWPALGFGLLTVLAPFLIMQPALGAGVAGAKTASPSKTRVHSLLTHLVFGLGLYLSAWLLSQLPI